jgi:hypothetical protein
MDAYFAISGCGGQPARRMGMPERERALALLLDDLDEAGRALAHDGDLAALLLDGMIARIANCWYTQHGGMEPDARDQLADLSQRDAPFARRLRLALGAPDPAARLAHARGLLRALGASERGQSNDQHDDLIDLKARAAG